MGHSLKTVLGHLSLAAALGAASLAAQASFTITLNYSGLTEAQKSYVSDAASFWESVITGYKDGVPFDGILISASGYLGSVGGVLASAGPTSIAFSNNTRYAMTGSMAFDTADIGNLISNGSFGDVIKHEMAHVIGFGTLWTINRLYSDGSGQYTGGHALAAYQTEFNQPTATFVPVELAGGEGTADGHWKEVNGGAGLTGIIDGQGRDMKLELMTGWLSTPTFVSQTTIAQFRDLGYTVFNPQPVPEPESWALLLFGIPLVAGLGARRRLQRS